MDFFKRLEKFDSALNRGYARWGKWFWGSLLAAILAYGGWLIWASIWGPPTGPVTLIIHSEIERPIRGFSVNGVAGSNAFVRDKSNPYSLDGGGATCCGSVSGENAEIIWTVDYTRAQYNKGIRTEIHKITVPLPERKWGENYLHVYFLPNNEVRLWWGSGFSHPKFDELPVSTTSINLQR